MSFVRLLPAYRGCIPLCSPPMNMDITRVVQAAEVVERELLTMKIEGEVGCQPPVRGAL
jgi:hypothetical protein